VKRALLNGACGRHVVLRQVHVEVKSKVKVPPNALSTLDTPSHNTNEYAGIQGVANTSNVLNQTGVVQYRPEADDFEFDDVSSSVEMIPTIHDDV
jgi:hypothetical protein